MKYQIYLQKDVSDIINTVAKATNQKPSTMIKQMLENNFRVALGQATELFEKGGRKEDKNEE